MDHEIRTCLKKFKENKSNSSLILILFYYLKILLLLNSFLKSYETNEISLIIQRKENNCSVDVDVVDGSSEIDSCNGLHPSAPRQTTVYCFQEPGGKIAVRFSYGMDCEVVACMGGMISLEEELDISL